MVAEAPTPAESSAIQDGVHDSPNVARLHFARFARVRLSSIVCDIIAN
jgi:hypothetical protein